MSEKRVFNLMRAIEKRQEQLRISKGLMDIKFNLDKFNITEIQKAIVKKIFKPIVQNKKMSNEEKLSKLLTLVNTGNLKVEVNVLGTRDYTKGVEYSTNPQDENYQKWTEAKEKLDSERKKKEVAVDVVYSKGFTKKTRPENKEFVKDNGVPLEVTIRNADGSNEQSFLSMLNLCFSKNVYKNGKKWSMYYSFVYYRIIDLADVLALVYLANELYNYAKSNEELRTYLLVRALGNSDLRYTMPNEDTLITINKFMERFNLPAIEKIEEYGSNRYVDWLTKDNLFKVEDVFHIFRDKTFVYKGSKEFDDLVKIFLYEMIRDNQSIKADCERNSDIETTYARSYETKQNIPLKVQKKMKHNKFLKWFGYVEFDELCDLKKVTHIEKEFVKFANFINLPIMKDHSLRFRRLGHHKASGLYFPSMMAVCVDIRNAYSMVHELFHMIDYTSIENTCLSNLINFRAIIDEYCRLTDKKAESLPEDSIIRQDWFSKNKYNKDYFQCPTEIFARCGEIYISKILGIKNSLCAIDLFDDLYYPDEERFLNMIEKYFKSVLGEVGVYNKDLEIDCASRSSVSNEKVAICDDNSSIVELDLVETSDGQLSLF